MEKLRGLLIPLEKLQTANWLSSKTFDQNKRVLYHYGIFHMTILLANIDFKTWAKFHCLEIFSSLFGLLWNFQSKLTNIRPFLLSLSCFLQKNPSLSKNKMCECPQRANDSPKQSPRQGYLIKTSPQAKRHKASLLFTSWTILTSLTFITKNTSSHRINFSHWINFSRWITFSHIPE